MVPTNEKIIEIKKCLLSGQEFFVTDKDLEFYDKVSPVFDGKKYSIPSPTLCSDERQRRRLSFRNEDKFYLRRCNLSGENIFSSYNPKYQFPVYKTSIWWNDSWDAKKYIQQFDTSRSFFKQFIGLDHSVPHPATMTDNGSISENCDFTQDIWYAKNCYLCSCGWRMRDCYFCHLTLADLDSCIDCLGPFRESSHCYGCTSGEKLHHCISCQNCSNCSGCSNCNNLIGCRNCFGCVNLKNKEYYICNKSFSPDEYHKIIANKKNEILREYENIKKYALHKSFHSLLSENYSGDYLSQSKNAHNCFDAFKLVDCRYYFTGDTALNCYDISISGVCQWNYENLTCDEGSMTRFCIYSSKCTDALYSQFCHNCKNIFGCVGLQKNQHHCILNKPYSVSEYETLCGKIIDHMISTGEWGEFFPHELSPFGYNETVAQEYFPMTEEEVRNMPQFHEWRGSSFRASEAQAVRDTESRTITTQSVQNLSPTYGDNIPGSRFPSEGRARGWNWYTEETKKFEGTGVQPLPIQEYDEKIVGFETAQKNIDTLLSGVVKCEVTGKPYKIIRQELAFYIENGIPIPTKHPDQRHKERMALRNPRKLYERQCMCEQCEQIAKETHTFQEENFVFFPLLSGEGQRVRSRKIITTYPPVGAQQFVSNSNPKVVCEECYRKLVY